MTLDDVLRSRASWETLSEGYRQHCADPSFVNYFWTLRSLQSPLREKGTYPIWVSAFFVGVAVVSLDLLACNQLLNSMRRILTFPQLTPVPPTKSPEQTDP